MPEQRTLTSSWALVKDKDLLLLYLFIREGLDIISTQLCKTRAAQEYHLHKKSSLPVFCLLNWEPLKILNAPNWS